MKILNLAGLLRRADLRQIRSAGKMAAQELGLKWNSNPERLIICLKNHPELIPGKITGVDLKSALIVWLRKYKNGLSNRWDTKIAKPSNAKRDPILDHVLRVSNPDLSAKDIGKIFENHALGMSIENNIGGLLEDYIASNLEPKDWISAWGSTVRAVDFYKPKEDKFLQVKNRSNSENSSSMSIRKGTNIQKWDRIDARTGKTHWEELGKITGVIGMSEEGFFAFVKDAIAKNPKLFYLGAIKSA
jgi:hypothetical protein